MELMSGFVFRALAIRIGWPLAVHRAMTPARVCWAYKAVWLSATDELIHLLRHYHRKQPALAA